MQLEIGVMWVTRNKLLEKIQLKFNVRGDETAEIEISEIKNNE